jgi:hypothetical protein
MFEYHAFAIACGGEIVRPMAQPIPAQAAVVLPESGGYESKQIKNVEFHGFVSIGSARSEVGGSYDRDRDAYTTYTSTVLEKVNFCDMVTADRIVARQSCSQIGEMEARRSSSRAGEEHEPSFNIVGTHFENLRVAGHRVDISLDIEMFRQLNTFSRIQQAYKAGKLEGYLLGGELLQKVDRDDYPALRGLREQNARFRYKNSSGVPRQYSLANHLKLEAPGLKSFGSIILVPDFGVVSLAELSVARGQRKLSMLRLDLGSPIEGKLVGATCGVGDGTDSTGPR